MPIHHDNFRNNLKLQLDSNPQLNGLDAFKRSLERDYFSELSISNCSSDKNIGSLVIEMNCNIELVELLFHYQKGTWGGVSKREGTKTRTNAFASVLAKLNELNSLPIDIEELSIFLNDSSIIIKRIYDQSIGEQFGAIINSVAENYVHITKGLTESPYEIYIPVFEENTWENHNLLSNIKSAKNSSRDYFSFWGIYFDSAEDAVIYDLSNKSFISGDLYMLNH